MEGSVEGVEDSENMILYYFSLINGEWHEIADTTKIVNGKFFFEGNMDELTAAELCFDNLNVVISARIYLEPTNMKLRINKSQPYAYELSGTTVEKENIELRKMVGADEKALHENLESVDDVLKQIRSNNHNAQVQDSLFYILNQYKTERGVYVHKMDQIRLDFIAKHNTYQIVPDLLYLLTKSGSISLDTIQSVYNNLPEQLKSGFMGKLFCKQIEYLNSQKNVSVGNPAPDFIREDFSGKTIRLSDFRDKNFVLLDFWASWCAPCIKEIPNVQNLYDKYDEKGLVIIGISSDDDSVKWLNAIDKYKLDKWPQILGMPNENNDGFTNDDIASVYHADAIPHFIFIDKQGKIIAIWEYLGEEQLIEMDKMLNNL